MQSGNPQTKTIKRLVLALIIVFGGAGYDYCHSNSAWAAEKKQDDSDATSRTVSDATDVHYNGKYCTVCHEQIPAKGNKFLKYGGDFKELCRCHYKTIARDLHPIGIQPSEDIKKRMPADFPLHNEKIDCITCHEITVQCRDDQDVDLFTRDQLFLRGAPYRKQTDFCFRCHNEIKFKKYNPHKQLNANGGIIELKCLYCHTQVPDVKQAGFEEVKLIGKLDILCDRCHNKAGEQSLHSRHLRKPSNKVFASIKRLENKYGIVLPLNENGFITCATCHNPHEKGVIPSERAGAKGADEKNRHRLPGNMCMQCHQM